MDSFLAISSFPKSFVASCWSIVGAQRVMPLQLPSSYFMTFLKTTIDYIQIGSFSIPAEVRIVTYTPAYELKENA